MKNKIILIILVAIIILFAVLTVLFAYKYINSKESIADLNSQIDTLNNELNSNKEEAVEKEVQEKYIIPKFDYEKGATYKEHKLSYNGYAAFTPRGTFNIADNTAYFVMDNPNSNYHEEHTYTIDERIIDGVRGLVGQGSNEATCLVGESGSVYINYLGYNGDDTMTKIESLSNICRVFATRSTNENGIGLGTVVAVDIYGNNYDLCSIYSDIINNNN